MSLERFCRKTLVKVAPNTPVDSVARTMREMHVGTVVVTDPMGTPLGVITDRDVACRVVAEGRDPRATEVSAVMSSPAATIRENARIEEAVVRMRELGVRRLPVVDGEGRLAGLVALDDLMVMLSAELHQVVQAIRENRGP